MCYSGDILLRTARKVTHQTPASIGNSVPSLSQSLSTKSKMRHATAEHAKKPGVRRKRDAKDAKQEDAVDDDNEADMLPVTDRAHSLRSLSKAERRATEQRAAAVVEAHHKEFMRRAFPPREIPIGIPQLTAAAMMTMVWLQSDLGYIDNVIRYWEPGVKIREMDPGYKKNRLRDFRMKNKHGFKFVKQYCLEDIHLPGGQTHTVVKTIEENTEGEMAPG
jgi:hypothetical protein